MESETIIPWFYDDYSNKRGRLVSGWLCHKSKRHHSSKRLNKLEQYAYIPNEKLPALKKFLQTQQFRWVRDRTEYPRVFNVLTDLEGKLHNGEGKTPKPGDIPYMTHFSRILLHRGQPYLVRIYDCRALLLNNGGVKLEMTFLDEYEHGSRRIVGLHNPHHKLRAMREFKLRVQRRFPFQDGRVFEDHSNGLPIEVFVPKLLKKSAQDTPEVYARMVKYIEKNGGIENISDLF